MPTRDFSAVYDEHVWTVYGFFAYRLRTRADAEDLTQQTFERALRAWGRYDAARAGVATWLLVIARNLLVDHLRAGGRRRERPLDALAADTVAAPSGERELGPGPEIERALLTLGDRERELIALRYGGDLSCAEIAALTGLSVSNVQQLLSRSLRRMRKALDGARTRTTA